MTMMPAVMVLTSPQHIISKVRNVKLLQGPTLETHIRPSILSFPDGNTQTFKEDAFSSGEYLKQHSIDNVNIIKPSRYKDWNELLVYYKRFDLNLGPGMKFIPAIEKTISQLNLRGYEQLANSISSSTKDWWILCLSKPITAFPHLLPRAALILLW